MDIREIENPPGRVFLNLALAYEAEFSGITRKKPDKDATFALDTMVGDGVTGYLLYIDSLPAGFAMIACADHDQFQVCEFYILPCFRRQGVGKQFAHCLFDKHPGQWQVKQIEGADHAVFFWRHVIAGYTDNSFTEDEYQDDYWGRVIRQVFDNR